MLRLQSHVNKTVRIATAGALALSLLAPVIMAKSSQAVQVTNRYVKMSTSAPGATGVTYEIGFTPSTTSFQSVVVEFCNAATGPIIGATCTATAGTDTPNFTVAAPVGGGTAGTTDAWTLGASATNVVKVNGAAVATGAAQMIHVSGVTNPSATGSFYARIYTYSNATYGTWVAGGTTYGNAIDTGGVALSTATAINITAKVQETLTFCVSKAAPGAGCSGTTAPNLALGHTANVVLDNTAVDVDTAIFQVSTNASGSVIVRMKGNVLTSGGNTIPAVNAGAGTPAAIVAGTAAFGMRSQQGVDSGTNTTIDANYNHATNYGYDTTTANNNTSSTYGDPIATVTAVSNSNTTLRFGATASLTTPAGLYTSTQNLIATGTY